MNRLEACSLINATLQRITSEKKISTEAYAILITIFPTVIAPALEIIDNGKVTKIICQESKRFFYRVREPSTNQGNKNRSAFIS